MHSTCGLGCAPLLAQLALERSAVLRATCLSGQRKWLWAGDVFGGDVRHSAASSTACHAGQGGRGHECMVWFLAVGAVLAGIGQGKTQGSLPCNLLGGAASGGCLNTSA